MVLQAFLKVMVPKQHLWSCSLLDLYARISQELDSLLFTKESCNVGVSPTLEVSKLDSRRLCLFHLSVVSLRSHRAHWYEIAVVLGTGKNERIF